MYSYLKYGTLLSFLALSTFVGNKIYRYATHDSSPSIALEYFTASGTYKDKVQFNILTHSNYKIAKISAEVDHKPLPLPNNGFIGKNAGDYPGACRHHSTCSWPTHSYYKNMGCKL